MSSALVNKHITRVLAAGADPTTIDAAWLNTADAYLTAAGLQPNLMFWPNPAFGTFKSGSAISRIACLGSTLLPRGGDYTPRTPASTTYSATGLNSTVPAWVNGTTTAHGFFGSNGRGTGVPGRQNPIRQKTGLTVIAVYQKGHANTVTLLSISEFGGFALQHLAGSPGNISFKVYGVGWDVPSILPATAVTAHIIGGTFDGTTVTVYVEGVAGTGATGVQATSVLTGYIGPSNNYFLASGTLGSKFTWTADAPTGTFGFNDAQAQYTGSDLIVFDKVLSPAEMTAIMAMLRTRIGP